jgi:hypothetical protein
MSWMNLCQSDDHESWCDGDWVDLSYQRTKQFSWDRQEGCWTSADGFYWLCNEHMIRWVFLQIAVLDI